MSKIELTPQQRAYIQLENEFEICQEKERHTWDANLKACLSPFENKIMSEKFAHKMEETEAQYQNAKAATKQKYRELEAFEKSYPCVSEKPSLEDTILAIWNEDSARNSNHLNSKL